MSHEPTDPAVALAQGYSGVLPGVGKYLEMYKVTLASTLAYIYDILFRQIFLIVIMFVFVQLWRTTYTWEGTSLIEGFSLRHMIWYLAFSESMVMAMPQAGRLIDEEVKSGSLAYSLSKPYNYPLFHYSRYLAEASVRFILNLSIAGGVTWLLVGPPVTTPVSAAAGLIAVVLGLCMDFLVQFAIGLTAFWIEDTMSLRFLYTRLVMIFGGMMLPLEVFPETLRRIASVLPTSLIVYGPVSTLISFDASRWTSLIMKELLWTALLIVLVRLIFRTGVRRVNVNGG